LVRHASLSGINDEGEGSDYRALTWYEFPNLWGDKYECNRKVSNAPSLWRHENADSNLQTRHNKVDGAEMAVQPT